jgi:membrane protein implicated in regulation of membrane protease activity
MSYPDRSKLLVLQIAAGLAGVIAGILSIAVVGFQLELATLALLSVTIATIAAFAVLRIPNRKREDERVV